MKGRRSLLTGVCFSFVRPEKGDGEFDPNGAAGGPASQQQTHSEFSNPPGGLTAALARYLNLNLFRQVQPILTQLHDRPELC